MSNPVLKVLDVATASIHSKHPWVLSTSLQKSIQPINKDSIVDLVDSKQRFIGRGFFNPDSRIAVRVYSWSESEQLDAAFFRKRIHEAISIRKTRIEAGLEPSTLARRLIFSEADRLSGLIVDAFGSCLVVQVTSAGILARLPWILEALKEAWSVTGILVMVDEATAKREGIDERHEVVFGEMPSQEQTLLENGVSFYFDLMHGQKTGHYLDQRQNRWHAAEWIEDHSRVLDVCCYSGGFACTIAKRRPTVHVTAIDSSQKALGLAAKNSAVNGLSNVSFEQNDFYEALEQRVSRGELHDAIVLDPPRMASSRSQVQRALAAYHRLNMLAVKLLRPGGVLVTCSCSGRVTREDFRNMLVGVSKRSGKEIQVLGQFGAADDHPTSINCPETDYLKCFVCKIWS